MVWTPESVEVRLHLARDVLMRMPDAHLRYLRKPLRSRMPEVVWDSTHAFAAAANAIAADRERMERAGVILSGGSQSGDRPRPGAPSGVEIDRMEEVLIGSPDRPAWLMYLSAPRRRMVWRRISGVPWWNIAAIEHRTERTCQTWFKQALEQIADELNAREIES